MSINNFSQTGYFLTLNRKKECNMTYQTWTIINYGSMFLGCISGQLFFFWIKDKMSQKRNKNAN